MPRPPRRAAPRRSRPQTTAESSSIVTNDEKRQLILAHAAARAGRSQPWGLGYYVAVAASCLIIVTGWTLTVKSGLRSQIPSQSDSILTTLRVNWEKYDEALRASRNSLSEGMKTLTTQATSTNEIK